MRPYKYHSQMRNPPCPPLIAVKKKAQSPSTGKYDSTTSGDIGSGDSRSGGIIASFSSDTLDIVDPQYS